MYKEHTLHPLKKATDVLASKQLELIAKKAGKQEIDDALKEPVKNIKSILHESGGSYLLSNSMKEYLVSPRWMSHDVRINRVTINDIHGAKMLNLAIRGNKWLGAGIYVGDAILGGQEIKHAYETGGDVGKTVAGVTAELSTLPVSAAIGRSTGLAVRSVAIKALVGAGLEDIAILSGPIGWCVTLVIGGVASFVSSKVAKDIGETIWEKMKPYAYLDELTKEYSSPYMGLL